MKIIKFIKNKGGDSMEIIKFIKNKYNFSGETIYIEIEMNIQ